VAGAREVALVLPIARARAVWDRAARFDLEAGGRFDRRGAAALVWSAPFDAAGDRAAPECGASQHSGADGQSGRRASSAVRPHAVSA
jgi:hypothetical protein